MKKTNNSFLKNSMRQSKASPAAAISNNILAEVLLKLPTNSASGMKNPPKIQPIKTNKLPLKTGFLKVLVPKKLMDKNPAIIKVNLPKDNGPGTVIANLS